MIVHLAYSVFSLEHVLGKVLFVDNEHHLLPRGSNNEFYEVSAITNILAVDSEALIAGKQTEVTNIMICHENWLKRFYVEPVQRS